MHQADALRCLEANGNATRTSDVVMHESEVLSFSNYVKVLWLPFDFTVMPIARYHHLSEA